jgi:two-component system, NtrC family, response regulator AtoC
LADQGVLFLDEIGDMHLSLQSKLLHALQSGEYSPLGSEKNVKTDTWVIAATNHDIVQAIAQKAFREDLYYRLSVIQIYIPPLRNRPDDVRCLLQSFSGELPLQIQGAFTRRAEPGGIGQAAVVSLAGKCPRASERRPEVFALG